MKPIYFLLAASLVWSLAINQTKAAEPVDEISKAEARYYYEQVKKRDPKLRDLDLFGQLKDHYGNKSYYKWSEVLLTVDAHALDKKVAIEYNPGATQHVPPMPRGKFSKQDATHYLKLLEAKDVALGKKDEHRWEALIAKYGDQSWYEPEEIADVEKNGAARQEQPIATVAPPPPSTASLTLRKLVKSIKIRKDWTEVVNAEDPSQTDTLKKSLDDLTGATFAFSHDANATAASGSKGVDTWSAVGAIVLPIEWDYAVKYGHFSTCVFAPSISINKLSTNGNPKNEVDHLDYRLGGYAKLELGDRGLAEMQFRAAFVYETDTEHRASLPAGELDVEPDLIFDKPGSADPSQSGIKWWSLGYVNALPFPRSQDFDRPMIQWQLRGWVHAEGGDLQRNGGKWDVVTGSFFRLGPMAQAKVNFPELLNGFSITGQYGYMGTVDGPTGRNNLWKVGGAFTIHENKTYHQKLSLTADYTRGGLLLSKQSVDVFNVGLGLVF